jgi:dynein heavy chain
MDYQNYHKYVDDMLPPESPILYGLHPNAEIGFSTNQADNLFKMILELQPRDFSATGIYGMSRDDKVVFINLIQTNPMTF